MPPRSHTAIAPRQISCKSTNVTYILSHFRHKVNLRSAFTALDFIFVYIDTISTKKKKKLVQNAQMRMEVT